MTGSVYIGNRGGVPAITTTATINTSNVVIILPNHIFRYLGNRGIVVVNLTQPITSTTTTLPILVSVNGNTAPLTNNSGTELTVADVANILVFEIYFDKSLNVLRVISPLS